MERERQAISAEGRVRSMKYYDICRHCKKNNNCEGFVEKTEDGFRDVFFCPKFTHDDGTLFSQADRIRSMSDEELAEWLTKITDDAQLDAETKCNYQWGEWLQSEVEE